MIYPTFKALTAERDVMLSRWKYLKRRFLNVEKDISLSRIEKTACAEQMKSLVLENSGAHAEKHSFQHLFEVASATRPEKKRKKGSDILSKTDVKFVAIASIILMSIPKYSSRETYELCLFGDEDLKRGTRCAEVLLDGGRNFPNCDGGAVSCRWVCANGRMLYAILRKLFVVCKRDGVSAFERRKLEHNFSNCYWPRILHKSNTADITIVGRNWQALYDELSARTRRSGYI